MLPRILPRVYAFWIVFTLAAAIAGAQDPPDCPGGVRDSLHARLSTEVDSLLAPWNRPGLPGAAVLVVQCGQILHKKGYGLADVALQRPMAPDTLFELGSITKPFTALAIMMLAERRQLRYDQSLTDFFPDFPPWARQITLRHLLSHTAGIPDTGALCGQRQAGSRLPPLDQHAAKHLRTDFPRWARPPRNSAEASVPPGHAVRVQQLRLSGARPGGRAGERSPLPGVPAALRV